MSLPGLSESEQRQLRRDVLWVILYLALVAASWIPVFDLRLPLSDAALRLLANSLVVTGLVVLGKCVWALYDAEYAASGNLLVVALIVEAVLYFLVTTQVAMSNDDIQVVVVAVVFGTTLAGIILLLIARERPG